MRQKYSRQYKKNGFSQEEEPIMAPFEKEHSEPFFSPVVQQKTDNALSYCNFSGVTHTFPRTTQMQSSNGEKKLGSTTTIQKKTADPKKRWTSDSFFDNYTASPDNKELNAQEVQYFEDYARRADLYLNRPNRLWSGKTKLTGKMFADAAKQTYLKYDKDISKVVPLEFALTQCQFESRFGMESRNPEKNPFNVGEYDSGTAPWAEKITDPAMGVAIYYDLMAEDYLSKTTPADLVKDGGFVNEAGDRYASNKDYEGSIRKQMGVVTSYIDEHDKGKPKTEIKGKPSTPTAKDTNTKELETIAQKVFNAMNGWGTDEQAVYDGLSLLNKDSKKINTFIEIYRTTFKQDLVEQIRSEFSDTWAFGNELSKALDFLNIKDNTPNGTPDEKDNQQKNDTPAFTPREADSAMRPDLDSNENNRAYNRWTKKGKASSYAESFNKNIEPQIKTFFGEDYTLQKVITEIEQAKKDQDLEKAKELEIKLYKANIYAVVETLDVENNDLYEAGNSKTYCNIYAYDVVTAMGGYLPRLWWYEKYEAKMIEAIEKGEAYSEKVEYGKTVQEMNANALTAWMPRIGQKYYGWEQASDMKAAQQAANDGYLVIILAANKVSSKSGHVNVILPETEQHKAVEEDGVYKPLQSQAGASNHKYKAIKPWWNNANHKDGAAWIAKGQLDSPLIAPEKLGGNPEGKKTTTANTPENKPQTPTPKEKTGTVTSDSLNVREGSGKDCKSVDVLHKGAKVTILETQNGWHRIGENRWVSGKFIALK